MRWHDVASWPNSHASRQIVGPTHRWHVQEAGAGDTLLFLHGAGGSTHSWRGLFPLLADTFHVVALDLPGHGFTQLGARHKSGLNQMAEDICSLADQEGWTPAAIIGHSAGAAVALRLTQRLLSPRGQMPVCIGLNAALGTFKGAAGVMFPIMAKLLAATPFAATLFSSAARDPSRIRTLLQSTGSKIDDEGVELYRRLVADRAHVQGTLLMMAQWNLTSLLTELPSLNARTYLLASSRDATVPPSVSEEAAKILPSADFKLLDRLGHLAHEEDPRTVYELIRLYLVP